MDGMPTGAEKITIDLRKRLYQGEWDVGEQIPPLAELAEHYQSSMAMMRRAQAPLIAEGWLRPQQGLGVYGHPFLRGCGGQIPGERSDLSVGRDRHRDHRAGRGPTHAE
jgi:DNA-binding transcriptional MocR family regulator